MGAAENVGGCAPTAFLPIVTKARELDARLLQALFLIRKGYRVVLGRAGVVNQAAMLTGHGLYLSPLMVPAAAPRLRALRAAGHKIIAWDEEGLVYPDPDWYFSNRVSALSAREADILISWGRKPAEDLAATLPDSLGPVLPVGNPRIDLLRAPFRRIYEDEAAAIRARIGPYILINSNFDLVNHIDGPDGLQKRMRASGRMAGPQDEAKFANWAVFRQAVFDAFKQGMPILHDALPDYQIVLRPHPSEDLAAWRALADAHPRMRLEPAAGPVNPWIVAADAIVHNSCTTAVEAFMLDTPVVAFLPEGVDSPMNSPLPNLLSRPAHSWPEAAALLRSITASGATWTTPRQIDIADAYIGARTGPTAAETIAELAAKLAPAGASLVRPGPVKQLRGAARRAVLAAGLRKPKSMDEKHRFGFLTREEVMASLDLLSAIIETPYRLSTYSEDAFVLESAA